MLQDYNTSSSRLIFIRPRFSRNRSLVSPRSDPSLLCSCQVLFSIYRVSRSTCCQVQAVDPYIIHPSVGNNSTFSDCQKLQYLKLSVKGEAATLLQSIQITNDNYKKAWNTLTEHYENEAKIINAALNKLVSQPILKQESTSGLQKLIDTTQQCIDTLQTLRQPVEYWDLLIIFLLRGKLDSETLRVWTLERTNKKNPSSSEFKSFVLSRATAIASLA
ncbi:uncharacterized protein TNCV_4226971 [Trichonephila clavipes]|nr:uncharacterized protein TNCV_4226971 [Trichonephila clavipes]